MEEKLLNEKESLELISQMILNAQKKMKAKSGSMFLLWGYTCFFVAVSVFIAYQVFGTPMVCFLWWLLPLIGYPLTLRYYKKKDVQAKTIIDRVISNIWIVIGISCMIVPVAGIFHAFPILFVESLMVSIGITLTGMVIKAKPVVIGGIIGFIAAYSILFLNGDLWQWQMIAFAFMVLVSMIIPGHLANRATKSI